MIIQELLEAAQKKAETKAQAKTATKERTKVNDLDDLLKGPTSKGSLAKAEPKAEPKGVAPKLKAAGAEKTRAKAATATIDPHHVPAFHPDDIDMSFEISDEEAARHAGASSTHHTHDTSGHEPKPVTPNTLPAVISKA